MHFSKIFNFLELFKIFENFKKVDYLWALSWQNATTSEVIFVTESLLQWLHLSSAMVPPSTFCKFSKIVFVISSYAFFELFKIFGFFNLFRNVEKFRKIQKFWKIQKKRMMKSRNLFLKIYKKVDEILTKPFFEKFKKSWPTDIHDLRIYATSRRIKISEK